MNNFIKLNWTFSIPWDGKFSEFPEWPRNCKRRQKDILSDGKFSGFPDFENVVFLKEGKVLISRF